MYISEYYDHENEIFRNVLLVLTVIQMLVCVYSNISLINKNLFNWYEFNFSFKNIFKFYSFCLIFCLVNHIMYSGFFIQTKTVLFTYNKIKFIIV